MSEDRGTFIYKCRNCRKKFSPVSYPNAMTSAIRAVQQKEGYNLLSVHRCLNGYIGIGDLIAVEPTDKEASKRIARSERG